MYIIEPRWISAVAIKKKKLVVHAQMRKVAMTRAEIHSRLMPPPGASSS
jgi:hypothetical protein